MHLKITILVRRKILHTLIPLSPGSPGSPCSPCQTLQSVNNLEHKNVVQKVKVNINIYLYSLLSFNSKCSLQKKKKILLIFCV